MSVRRGDKQHVHDVSASSQWRSFTDQVHSRASTLRALTHRQYFTPRPTAGIEGYSGTAPAAAPAVTSPLQSPRSDSSEASSSSSSSSSGYEEDLDVDQYEQPEHRIAARMGHFEKRKQRYLKRLSETLLLMDNQRVETYRGKLSKVMQRRLTSLVDDLVEMREDAETERERAVSLKQWNYEWFHRLLAHLEERDRTPTDMERRLLESIQVRLDARVGLPRDRSECFVVILQLITDKNSVLTNHGVLDIVKFIGFSALKLDKSRFRAAFAEARMSEVYDAAFVDA